MHFFYLFKIHLFFALPVLTVALFEKTKDYNRLYERLFEVYVRVMEENSSTDVKIGSGAGTRRRIPRQRSKIRKDTSAKRLSRNRNKDIGTRKTNVYERGK